MNLEQQRFSKVFKKLSPGGFLPIKVVLGSRAFCRGFTLDLKKMASSDGDNGEDKPTEGTILIASDEGKFHHSQDEHP